MALYDYIYANVDQMNVWDVELDCIYPPCPNTLGVFSYSNHLEDELKTQDKLVILKFSPFDVNLHE